MKKFALCLFLSFLIAITASLSSCFSPKAGIRTENHQERISDKNITIKLWHIWNTDIDANRTTLEAGLNLVKKAYPEIAFEVDATENETYKTRIKTAIAVNDAPDIFFAWGGGFSEFRKGALSGSILYCRGAAGAAPRIPAIPNL